MAWSIPLGPSSLSAPLAFSIPAGIDLALTYPLSPPPLLSSLSSPLTERDPQPRREEQAGKGDPAPRHIYWAAVR